VPKVEVVLQNNTATTSRPARGTPTHPQLGEEVPTSRSRHHPLHAPPLRSSRTRRTSTTPGNPLARNALHTLSASAQVIHNLDSPFFFRPENWKSPQYRGKGKESPSTNYVQQTLPTSFSQGNPVSAEWLQVPVNICKCQQLS